MSYLDRQCITKLSSSNLGYSGLIDNYIKTSAGTPESFLIDRFMDYLLGDLEYFHNKRKMVYRGGIQSYEDLVSAADWVFTEPYMLEANDGEGVYLWQNPYWVFSNVYTLEDAEGAVYELRRFILDLWSDERLRERLRRSGRFRL